jgi:GTPase
VTPERPKAVIVGVRLPDDDERAFDSSLVELERLVTTLGYEAVGRVTQARPSLAPAAVLGEGKLMDLAALTGGTGHVGTTAPKRRHKAAERWGAGEDDDEGKDEGEESEPSEKKVDLVAVDHEISPSQARNLERSTTRGRNRTARVPGAAAARGTGRQGAPAPAWLRRFGARARSPAHS